MSADRPIPFPARPSWDDEATLLADLAREIQACATDMEITFQAVTVFQIAAVVQLALRHPDVPAHLRVTARTFLEGVRAYFTEAHCPAVLEALRRGDRLTDRETPQ